MSILNLNRRSYIIFDPDNREHRRAAHEFKKTQGWGSCKFRFVIDNNSLNLIDMIDKRLIAWYLANEFKRDEKKEKSQ